MIINYSVTAGSGVLVQARSSIHDTQTRWQKVSGSVTANPATLSDDGAQATITVDMRSFDAGDWLKNRKLKKDLAVDSHPQAEFTLSELTDVVPGDNGSFSATAKGVMKWRGRQAQITATGTGTVTEERISATATFELDVTTLGVTPPKILMFKVDKVVSVEVTLVAVAN